MKEVTGDFWTLAKYAQAICVTTNGIVKANGELVMGKGIALDFAIRYPGLPRILGGYVKETGNMMYIVEADGKYILSFPTKHHWRDKSDIKLIIESAKQLEGFASNWNLSKVLLTRPGCGNGGLDWQREVKPAIQDILDDRFVVVSPKPRWTGTVACI